MKKILITINNCKLAGIERFVILLSKYIDKSRFKLIVALPCEGELTEIFKEINQPYFVFNSNNKPERSISGFLRLMNFIRKGKFDIIHAQAGIYPCVIGKIFSVPRILEHKHGLDYTTEQIKNMSWLKKKYESIKKKFVDLTITVCEHDKKLLVTEFGYEEKKIAIIYNCIEHSADIAEINKDVSVIGNIGRLTYQKDQTTFIHMAKILSSEYPELKFHIFGKGEKYDEYSELIKKLGLSDRVKLTGFVNDVKKLFRSIDILVLSSRYEGIPFVLLESMSNGVPVVATRVGGIPEIIQDSFNGFLVPKESPEELANRVRELISNYKLRKMFSDNSRNILKDNFTVDKMLEGVQDIYST